MTLPYGSANQVPYATSVAAQLGQVYLWDPAFALASDPEVYEKMLRDPVIAGSLDHLQRLVVGHDWSFEPEEDEKPGRLLAKVLEGLTKQQRGFPQALYNLSRASFMGAAWGLMFPERRTLRLGDGKPREWTVISRVRDIDKRRFRLTQVEALGQSGWGGQPARDRDHTPGLVAPAPLSAALDPKPESAYDAGVLGAFRWEFNRGYAFTSRVASSWWGPLSNVAPDERWIQHVPDTSERGMGYGYGLADDLYFYYWAKQQVLKFGLQGLERWGQGFLYAKVKALREGFAKGASQSSAMTQTIASLRTWRSENFAVVDQDTELALLDMPATAEAACREWITYLDGEIVKRCLAALQPTGGQAGHGSFSSSKVEEGSTEAMVAFLRSPLEETWTHTVVRFLVEHNQDNLRDLGLADLGRPRLRLRGKEQRDVEQMIHVFQLARELNMPVRKSDFYEVFGLSAPNEEDGDDTIEYPAPVAPGGPGAGPGFGAPGLDGQDDGDTAGDPPALTGSDTKERAPVGSGGQSVAETAMARVLESFAARDALLERRDLERRAQERPEVHVYNQAPEVRPQEQRFNFPPAQVTVNVPRQEPPVVHFHPSIQVPRGEAPRVTVNVPQQAPPTVNVSGPESPEITVNVPQGAPPVVQVDARSVVNVPQQAAPGVTVNVPAQAPPTVTVQMPRPEPKKVTYTRDAQGNITGSRTEPG